MVIKLLGLVINLILIRVLDKQDYAYYTIANTMIFTLSVLSNSGISSGLSAIGGRVWNDKVKLSQLIRTGLYLRNRMALLSAILLLPVLAYLLTDNGASWHYTFIIAAFVLLGAIFQLQNALYCMVFKLKNQFNRLQQTQLSNSILRLLLISVLSLWFLNAALVMAFAAFAFWVNWLMIRQWTAKLLDKKQELHEGYKNEILGIVKHQLPNNVYYAVKGQLAVFLIGFFGTTKMIAEVGALGRLAMVFSVLTLTTNAVILPQFAKSHQAGDLRKKFVGVIGFFILLTLGVTAFAAAWPQALLWLLGKDYMHLRHELLLMVLGTLLNIITGLIFHINSSKGWIVSWWFNVPMNVLVQILLIIVLNISTVSGVLWLSLLSTIPNMIVFTYIFWHGIRFRLHGTTGIEY